MVFITVSSTSDSFSVQEGFPGWSSTLWTKQTWWLEPVKALNEVHILTQCLTNAVAVDTRPETAASLCFHSFSNDWGSRHWRGFSCQLNYPQKCPPLCDKSTRGQTNRNTEWSSFVLKSVTHILMGWTVERLFGISFSDDLRCRRLMTKIHHLLKI